MVSEGAIFGALSAMIGGLYLAFAILNRKMGKMLANIENNAVQAKKNTELLHDHLLTKDNPHPKELDHCSLCEDRED